MVPYLSFPLVSQSTRRIRQTMGRREYWPSITGIQEKFCWTTTRLLQFARISRVCVHIFICIHDATTAVIDSSNRHSIMHNCIARGTRPRPTDLTHRLCFSVDSIGQAGFCLRVHRKLRESARARSWRSNCRPRLEKLVVCKELDTSLWLSTPWRVHAVLTQPCMAGTSTNSRSSAIGMKRSSLRAVSWLTRQQW